MYYWSFVETGQENPHYYGNWRCMEKAKLSL
jgi:hypothetical protein